MDLEIRLLNSTELSLIRELENKELNKDDPDNHYTYDDDNFYNKALFNNGGSIFGVFDNHKLVAFAGNILLSSYETDYFLDKLKERGITTSQNKVAFFNNTLVSKDYRGMKIQKKLREITIEHYIKNNIYEFISTTSQENIPSAKNLLKLGMRELKSLDDTPYSNKLKRFFYLNTQNNSTNS